MGDRLVFNQPLQTLGQQTNPGAFNYTAYLARNNIHHRLFLKANQYRLIDSGKTNLIYQTTNTVLSVLRKNIPGKQEQAIAEALLIGYTFDLEDELLNAYSRTGVIHIIAISGMHLGLVYGILLFATSPFKKIKYIRWLRPVVILISLWIFSLLVGAGASVLRASIIFSFILLGELLLRKNNAYNSLAASMFCLLCFNPYYLWDLGFQLSYAAVTGIIIFTKPIYHYWYIPHKFFRYCWQLIVVTCSAQVFTIPITLYHFHQFPNLFLLTNLIVVPMSGLVLYGCMFLLLVAPFHFIAHPFGEILGKALQLMNQFIFYVEKQPFAVTDYIQINPIQICCYIMLIVFGCRWIMLKKPRYFLYMLGCISIITFTYAFRHIRIGYKKQLIVYQLPGSPVTEIIGGGQYISIARSEHLIATKKMRTPAHTLLGGFISKNSLSPEEYSLFSVNGLRIVVLNQKVFLKPNYPKIEADILILQNNLTVTIARLQEMFKVKIYVWDINNALWKIGKWKKEADSLHLRHHSIPEQGAFVMDF